MITRDEITRSLTGAWEIFLDRPNAMRHFDTDYAGFWRSFQAIILIAPLYALTAFAAYRALETRIPASELPESALFLWARAVTLGFDWVTLPILLAVVASVLGIQRTYTSFVVARNWSTVLIVTPFALIAALELVFNGIGPLVVPLSLLATAAVLRFAYLVARHAMEANVGLAIGIVVLDFFLSLFLAATVNVLFGLPAAA